RGEEGLGGVARGGGVTGQEGQLVLDRLEGCQGAAELDALRHVLDRLREEEFETASHQGRPTAAGGAPTAPPRRSPRHPPRDAVEHPARTGPREREPIGRTNRRD